MAEFVRKRKKLPQCVSNRCKKNFGVRGTLSHEDRKLEIQLKGCKLEQANNVELLGLELNKQLSFTVHTDCLCKKISKHIGMLNRIKAYLPKSERILY